MKEFKTINQNKADIEIGYKESKKMYSEEEVIKILYQFHYDLVNSNFDTKEEWFEQFSKLKNG